VQILGEVGDKGAIDQLIMLARPASETDRVMPAEVRLGAASALAKLGLPQGAFVADEYREDGQAVLRAQAASVYGDTRRSESLRTVVGLSEDGSEEGLEWAGGGRIGSLPSTRYRRVGFGLRGDGARNAAVPFEAGACLKSH
jgi:HEAT repeat protein